MSEIQARALLCEAAIRPTEMGVQVMLRTEGVICTYEFDLDTDPRVLESLIGISPQAIQDLMAKVAEEEAEEEP